MSRKFYAVNRLSGESWKPNPHLSKKDKEFLVMYDSGYLAVVWVSLWETSINPLDPKIWEKVLQGEDNGC